MNANRPRRAETALRFLLRYLGTASLLALAAVFMPASWIDATHRWLGLGPLPQGPIVGYLARSLSLFYALLGGLLWVISFDLQRHRQVLWYLGGGLVVFGAAMWGIDIVQGLPAFWRYGEGPIVILFGVATLALNFYCQPKE